MKRWRIRRPTVDALLDLERPVYPGELDRALRAAEEDERNAADLDELEAEDRPTGFVTTDRELDELAAEAVVADWARTRLLPTIVISVTAGPGASLDLSLTGPLGITRQLVELALSELDTS